MNFDPETFFIRLMDFFSILLPGALLRWLLMDKVGPVVLRNRDAKLDGVQAWATSVFTGLSGCTFACCFYRRSLGSTGGRLTIYVSAIVP